MNFPAAIRSSLEGARLEPVHIGMSGASVYRVRMPAGVLFLKTRVADEFAELREEAERLRWMQGRVSVPGVVSFAKEDGYEYLLLTGLPGMIGVEVGTDRAEDVTRELARALKVLHSHPLDGCPFDQSVSTQIERACRRVQAGVVNEEEFDDERLGRTARELFVELEAWQPADEARALTHGDPCLPNVMFEAGRFAGFIDCGRFGVADPYQDLALAARSIEFNLGAGWVAVFFKEYGIPETDERKLAFYRLLDEFF